MYRLLINPRYESWREALLMIPKQFDSATEVLRDSRNVIKVMTAPDGTRINVKRFHKPKFPNNLIYSFDLRQPKGIRAFMYPYILKGLGIETPEAVAYIEERDRGLIGLSYFVSLQCPYPHRLYELGDAAKGTYDGIARALARLTARMHDSGIMHRDYSPGNILWEEAPDGYRFSLVDINRMYFGLVSMDKGCANFARLWGPKRLFSILARTYAEERGLDPDQCEALVLRYRKKFWKKYARKHHVDYKLEL